MPELPEVEVSRMGISPYTVGQTVTNLVIRQAKLRWQIPETLAQIKGQVIQSVSRRAKYLLLETELGDAIIHLGMSGNLRVLDQNTPAGKHDHVELWLSNGKMIRYQDPRRFGAWLWQDKGQMHSSLVKLGPEPLSDEFDETVLAKHCANKTKAIKTLIMDNQVVVGVGNIYANESLFLSQIAPTRPAHTLTKAEISALVEQIKQVLTKAIAQGGTTLKDFAQTDGKPGYFAQSLLVYGKQGQPCPMLPATFGIG